MDPCMNLTDVPLLNRISGFNDIRKVFQYYRFGIIRFAEQTEAQRVENFFQISDGYQICAQIFYLILKFRQFGF